MTTKWVRRVKVEGSKTARGEGEGEASEDEASSRGIKDEQRGSSFET